MQTRCHWLAVVIFLTPSACPPAHGDPGKEKPAHVDYHGDPLPDGAVARLGTARFRHGGTIIAGVFAPDGKTLTTYGSDEMIRTWEVPSGRLLREVARQGRRSGYVRAAVFSNNGQVLALAIHEPNDHDWVQLCDANTGCERRRLTVGLHDVHYVSAIALSDDGALLAVGNTLGGITTWNIATGERLYSAGWNSGRLNSLVFSPDGTILASGSDADCLALWDARREVQLKEIMKRAPGNVDTYDFPSHLAFSLDGKTLVSANSDHALRLWDMTTGAERVCLRQVSREDDAYPWKAIDGVAVSSDGATIAAVTREDTLLLWDVKTAAKPRRIELGHRQQVVRAAQPVCFAPHGKILATWGRDNAVRLWDVGTGKEMTAQESPWGKMAVVAFSPDGSAVAAGGEGDSVQLWETRTGRLIKNLRTLNSFWIHALAFSPDGKVLACGHDCGWIPLFSMPDGNLKSISDNSFGSSTALVLTPDSRTLVCASGRVFLRDWRTGKDERQLETDLEVRMLALSRDGRFLVTCGRDVRIWNTATGKELFQVQPPGEQEYRSVALLPDGRSLLALDFDGMLRWIEIASGKERRCWQAGNAFALSTDDNLVVSAGNDGEVHLWNLATGKLLKSLRGHRGRVLGVAFSQDNKLLASAGADTTVLIWDMAPLRNTQQPNTRQLSPKQLEQLWNDLDGEPAVAAVAMAALRSSPEQAVSLFQKCLPPVSRDVAHRRRLIADLDANEFTTRRAAFRALVLFGAAAVPDLHDARKATKSAEARRQVDELLDKTAATDFRVADEQVSRALEVLEACGTAEAKRLLESLSTGEPQAWLTREAKATLERLAKD